MIQGQINRVLQERLKKKKQEVTRMKWEKVKIEEAIKMLKGQAKQTEAITEADNS